MLMANTSLGATLAYAYAEAVLIPRARVLVQSPRVSNTRKMTGKTTRKKTRRTKAQVTAKMRAHMKKK
jgi:hypothetical protein